MLLHEIAKETGLHSSTILRLEKRGYIKPSRDWNGWRRFSKEDVRTLRRLLRGGRVDESDSNGDEG